ncbi:DUF2243 domain-containing protein [Actinoplanes sp. GCM10030250]|uniref:DUF2243 domain-containing protein n=1 Tax=Actinoplanes sp. GCM10030250 TaxID=3273376 RepID=UPI003616FFE6
MTRVDEKATSTDIALPGILLGVGLGGFLDGILLHQVLQWHHLVTGRYSPDTVPGLRTNTLWDGLFHTFTWLSVLIGLGLLYSRVVNGRTRMWRSRALWGWILTGWGIFNVVEGIIDHHILGIHHVRSGPGQIWWDLGFLALGAALIAAGWLLQRGATVVGSADRR